MIDGIPGMEDILFGNSQELRRAESLEVLQNSIKYQILHLIPQNKPFAPCFFQNQKVQGSFSLVLYEIDKTIHAQQNDPKE